MNVDLRSTLRTSVKSALTELPPVGQRDSTIQWAKAARRALAEKTKGKEKLVVENKAQKDTEYGPKTEITEEFGSHPKRNGKERKAEFRIQRFISKSIPGILQARGAQAG